MKPVAEETGSERRGTGDGTSRGVKLQAVQIANGANELLTEVSTSKITGEEERYSHIDLVDFKANVEGSQVAFEAVAPLMRKDGPELVGGNRSRLRRRLHVAGSRTKRRNGSGFVLYEELDKADTRKLAQGINALAEKLSLVLAQIAKGDRLNGHPPGEGLAWSGSLDELDR